MVISAETRSDSVETTLGIASERNRKRQERDKNQETDNDRPRHMPSANSDSDGINTAQT